MFFKLFIVGILIICKRLMQLYGDLGDLEHIFNYKKKRFNIGHCSGLIKLLKGNKDIYVSHVTWTGYNTMLRIAKFYDIPVHFMNRTGAPIVPGRTMSFSSYPGQSNSLDDFYTIGSTKLAAIETTNNIHNEKLYKRARRQINTKILEYMRVLIANRLAKSGLDWVRYFKEHNSGTYNNQWMIVDYKNFRPGHSLPNTGVLMVAEQIPGRVVWNDFTEHLSYHGYWASYNIPAFPVIYKEAGYEPLEKKLPDFYSYLKCARSKIFFRDQGKVVDLKSMMRLMRYNNYKKDPFSRCNCTPPYLPTQTISSRYDLIQKKGKYPLNYLKCHAAGATDMKVTNFSMVHTAQFIGISGPTYDQVPVFQWSKSGLATATNHLMQPDKFNFPPVLMPYKMKHSN